MVLGSFVVVAQEVHGRKDTMRNIKEAKPATETRNEGLGFLRNIWLDTPKTAFPVGTVAGVQLLAVLSVLGVSGNGRKRNAAQQRRNAQALS
jgi:hypothetical protein